MFDSDAEFFYILAIFCLIVKRGVLTSQTITVDLSVSPFSFISFASHNLQLCGSVHLHLLLLCLPGRLNLPSLYNALLYVC